MKKKILIVEDSPEYVQIIKTGLSETDRIVVGGLHKVMPGALVEPMDESAHADLNQGQ